MPSNPNSRRQIRLVLISIILATIPCYCLGLFAASLAPDRGLSLTGTPTTYCYHHTHSDHDPLPEPDPVRQRSCRNWHTHADSHTLADTNANPDGYRHSNRITHLHSLGHTASLCCTPTPPPPPGTATPTATRATARRELRHAIPVMDYLNSIGILI